MNTNELNAREIYAVKLFAQTFYNFCTAANLVPTENEMTAEALKLYKQVLRPQIDILIKEKQNG
jgi:hypothetical protein